MLPIRLRINGSQVLDGAILFLLLGSVAAIGAVHPISVLVAGIVTVVLYIVISISRRKDRQNYSVPLFFWCLLLAGFWSVLQTLPLGGLVSMFSSATAESWEVSGVDGSYLSCNLVSTRLMAAKCFAAALLFWVAFRTFHRIERISLLVLMMVVVATLVAILGFVQEWFRTESVLFLYEPVMGPVRSGMRGTFVNPDSFGAYMAVIAILALGRGLGSRLSQMRFVYYGIFVILLSAMILSFSLSAMVGFIIGAVSLVVLWRRQQIRISDVVEACLLLTGIAAVGAVIAIKEGVVPEPGLALAAQLESLSRLGEIWSESLAVALRSPLTGVGSGALSDLLASRLEQPTISVWFARNQLLQFVIDFGFPVGIALIAGMILIVRASMTPWPSEIAPTVIPIVAALFAIAGIAMVDFALEIPAIGIVGILLAGSISRQASRYRRALRGRGKMRRGLQHKLGARWLRSIPPTLAALGLLMVGLWTVQTEAEVAESEINLFALAARPVSEDFDVESLAQSGLQILATRPANVRVYVTVAAELFRRQELEVAKEWLERAIRFNQEDPEALRLLGATLLRLGRTDEGVARLSQVLESAPDQTRPAQRRNVVLDLISSTADVQTWMLVASDDETRRTVHSALLSERRYVELLSWASALLSVDSSDPRGLEAAGQASLEMGLEVSAQHFARALLEIDEESVIATLILAAIERQRGEPELAVFRLEPLLEAHPDDSRLLMALGESLVASHQNGAELVDFHDTMERIRERLRPMALSRPELAQPYHDLSARYYLATEQWLAAASAARHGLEVAPESYRLHESLGISLAVLENNETARFHLMRALEINGEAVQAQQLLDQLNLSEPGPLP